MEDCMKTEDKEQHIKQIEHLSQLYHVMRNAPCVLSLWETLWLPYLLLTRFRGG